MTMIFRPPPGAAELPADVRLELLWLESNWPGLENDTSEWMGRWRALDHAALGMEPTEKTELACSLVELWVRHKQGVSDYRCAGFLGSLDPPENPFVVGG